MTSLTSRNPGPDSGLTQFLLQGRLDYTSSRGQGRYIWNTPAEGRHWLSTGSLHMRLTTKRRPERTQHGKMKLVHGNLLMSRALPLISAAQRSDAEPLYLADSPWTNILDPEQALVSWSSTIS
ncbi:hypothetical protein G7Z17_g7758 [Cylindrodendrum hubeiense]|uniref:Uncharacterized protein n=1 Tax=Cylindrodendrum hubeiense TaxID=595255 RepID=A0A9P5H506_9HYPO|nr:hypothetical protein G7Z17_g7758 [Cylindrodendrum hubeiense]